MISGYNGNIYGFYKTLKNYKKMVLCFKINIEGFNSFHAHIIKLTETLASLLTLSIAFFNCANF